jgi:NAD(P)-dependent dehydrogenase (short-subunit alcohol dehydrogenase family)
MLLTGASRGIGHSTCRLFAAAGWRVITVSRSPFVSESKCPWKAGDTNHVICDLSSKCNPRWLRCDLGYTQACGSDSMCRHCSPCTGEEDTVRAIAEIKTKLGGAPLHALVNNAAISPKNKEGQRLGAHETDVRTWNQVLQVNLLAGTMLANGLFEELKAAVPAGGGSVVNVTSIVGSRVHPFAGTAYACSKAALAALTREMAVDFGQHGVRVNAISPGEIDTSILSPGTQAIVDEEIPMRRLGTVNEVAHAIYFLVSEQSSYVNGAELHINGGQHC